MLVPMMVRLAVQFYHGKPMDWEFELFCDLYSKEELKQLTSYKKKVDPADFNLGSSSQHPKLDSSEISLSQVSLISNFQRSSGSFKLFRSFQRSPRRHVPV
jgi:hypothetical protein